MLSSRERRPSTGRTNLSNNNLEFIRPQSSSRPNTANLNSAKTSSQNETPQINGDPLQLHRPYTPEFRPPPDRRHFLPNPYEKTVNFPKTEKRYKKPSICPDGWVEKLQEPTWFEKADFKTMLDTDKKREFARKFIERNQDRMWKYNYEFKNKTPQEVCEMLIQDQGFVMTMMIYEKRERTLDFGTSSINVYGCLDEKKLSIPKSKRCYEDPYIMTITTSRNDRQEKMNNLLKQSNNSSFNGDIPNFKRGYAHTVEIGNFSRYNGVLKTNSQSILNR